MSDVKLTNIPSMTIGKAVDKLSHPYTTVIQNRFPVKTMPSVMLWGPPGVGKLQAIRQIAKKIEKENMQDMFCLFEKEDLSLKLALKLTYKDKRYTFYQGYKPFTQMFYQDILENMNSIIKKNK